MPLDENAGPHFEARNDHTLGRFLAFIVGLAFAMLIVTSLAYAWWGRRHMRMNEDRALDCARGLWRAEKAFAEANGGSYAPPFCILDAASCGRASAAPVTLPACFPAAPGSQPEALARVYSSGYDITFVSESGPSVPTRAFVVTFEPVLPGKSGSRSFGLDETGRICSVRIESRRVPLRTPSGGLRPDCDATH